MDHCAVLPQEIVSAGNLPLQAAELLVRYLGGDMCIIDEVCALRGLQEELAAERPDDPRRIFGEAVDATCGTSGAAVTITRLWRKSRVRQPQNLEAQTWTMQRSRKAAPNMGRLQGWAPHFWGWATRLESWAWKDGAWAPRFEGLASRFVGWASVIEGRNREA